ncbi:cadherin-8 isoform 2-T3 [Liasis olivaceus]
MPEGLAEMLMDTWAPLVILWITAFPSIYMAPMNHSQVLPSRSSRGLNDLNEEQRVLNRSKRGWVWNQMFVLEEFSGPEPILVGRLHTDLDPGSSKIKYILSGDGAGTIFVINDKTGDIHAMKRLDREEKAEYTLTAQAVDRDTNKPLEPPSEFIIKVQDINDNPPEFVEGPYHATVPEMSLVGTYVTKVTATDADDPVYGNSAKLVYSILEGQPYFSVEPHTGLYHFSILEDIAIGEPVGRVKANDLDIGENAKSSYDIIEGDGMDIFEITSDSQTQEGIIRLRKPLDFETKSSYTLKVEATNVYIDPRFISVGPFKDTATVKIVVEDADEPPVFSSPTYLLEVHENAAINSVIGQVTAHDPDGSSSSIRFSIDRNTDLERQFNINTQDGRITLATPLDRETSTWHNITIVAMEERNPSQISRVPVAIKVLDVNDNAPELVSGNEAYLCENGKTGKVIHTMRVIDKDDPKNGHYFVYNLPSEMANNPNFTIKENEDNTFNILTKRNGFSRQKQEVYFLPIIISDSGNPPMSSTSTLTIKVCGCSNDGIAQSCNAEAYVLPIGLSMGALIAILACIILLLVIVVLFVTLRRHKNEPLIIKDDEDVRENIIRYDDEGGGEEDTEAFDIATLQNPDGINGFLPRKDIKPDLQFMPRQGLAPVPNGVDVDEFINVRLHEADNDPTAPPYDSIQIYGYEGRGSVAGSLSSLESSTSDSDQNFDYLSEWGPRFKRLGELYSVGESDKET